MSFWQPSASTSGGVYNTRCTHTCGIAGTSLPRTVRNLSSWMHAVQPMLIHDAAPVDEAVEYMPKLFSNRFDGELSRYQGWPTDETDARWQDLYSSECASDQKHAC